LQGLTRSLFGGDVPVPTRKALAAVENAGPTRTIQIEPEPGLTLTARQDRSDAQAKRLAVLIDLDGADKAAGSELASALRREGWSVLTMDLRATGQLAYARDGIGRAPDHNTARWSLWIGRPLLGQWVLDVRRLLDALQEDDGSLPGEILAAGVGPAGLVAVCAAALDSRITHAAAIGMLASFVTEEPYQGQRLGIMVPGMLRHAGDIPHLATLVAPRRLVVAGAIRGGGQPLDADALSAAYSPARQAYALEAAADNFRLLPAPNPAEIVNQLK